MATNTKKATATKKTVPPVEVTAASQGTVSAPEVTPAQPSFDFAEMMRTIQQMNSNMENLTKELNEVKSSNEDLKRKNFELEEKLAQEAVKVKEQAGQSVQSISSVVPDPAPVITGVSPTISLTSQTPDKTDQILEYLSSRKSDKEITIVHNRELNGGLSTHIELTGLTIDFHTLGEHRTLSWQQFEECVSKYRKWFLKEIILVDSQDKEVADNYNVPVVNRKGAMPITRSDLYKLGSLSIHQLEDYYHSLSVEDQGFMCSFWLGKCYEKDPAYYDRHKVECMSRLANNGAFDNIIALMNNDYPKTSKEEVTKGQGQKIGTVR